MTELVEIFDEAGRVLGIVSPLSGRFDHAEVPVTDEEVIELRRQPRGRPLKEILTDWKAIA